MTHVKLVEGFEKLVDFCSGYGGKYNPGSPNLHINQLNALLAQAKQALHNAKAAKAGYDQQSNQREIVFDDIRRLASGVVLTLAASGASAQTVKDARTWLRQLNGRRAGSLAPAANAPASEEPVKTRSVAQQAFINQIDHLAGLVLTVTGEPRYTPNEADFTVDGLNAKVAYLRLVHQNTTVARKQWSNARIERNRVLYMDLNAVHSTAKAVKQYVRAVYGSRSEQYQQLKSLRFTKPNI